MRPSRYPPPMRPLFPLEPGHERAPGWAIALAWVINLPSFLLIPAMLVICGFCLIACVALGALIELSGTAGLLVVVPAVAIFVLIAREEAADDWAFVRSSVAQLKLRPRAARREPRL